MILKKRINSRRKYIYDSPEITLIKRSSPDIYRKFRKLLDEDIRGCHIWKAGCIWGFFDFEKAFTILLRADEEGEWIYKAGRDWKWFDYEKGLERLLEIDKRGRWIYHAGCKWRRFDYNKAFKRLLEVDEEGDWVYNAGRDWKWFDYDKAFELLLNKYRRNNLISKAIFYWRWSDDKRKMAIEESIENYLAKYAKMGNLIRKRGLLSYLFMYAKKLDDKWIEIIIDTLLRLSKKYNNIRPLSHIYRAAKYACLRDNQFIIKTVIKYDKSGKYICLVTKDLVNDNYTRQMMTEKLLQTSKSGKWLYIASCSWVKLLGKEWMEDIFYRLIEIDGDKYKWFEKFVNKNTFYIRRMNFKIKKTSPKLLDILCEADLLYYM